MIGVSDPFKSRTKLREFLVWYWIGSSAGTVTSVLLLLVVGQLIQLQTLLAVLFILCFGLLDLLGKTPMLGRQTPQRIARVATPGVRGLIWGFDIGLVWSTRKTTSLLWSGALLLPSVGGHGSGILVAVVASFFYLAPLSYFSYQGRSLMDFLSNTSSPTFRRISFALHVGCAALVFAN